MFKKSDHKPDWGQLVKSHNLRVFYALSPDKLAMGIVSVDTIVLMQSLISAM